MTDEEWETLLEGCRFRVEQHTVWVDAETVRAALGPWIAQQRADAVREIIDAWQWGGWADALLGKPRQGPIATAQAVTDWFRARTQRHNE